ncbi:hypothetical protein HJC23_007430 [Cyclotella cryptica]|uniref:CCT domain-containing protein n=1 Tax=Cyclotella cryptica TaxID=29204 RepID=A0ABD3QIV6_9STRA|eukprot:CCRYP_005182-RA/>CCRYP_005182-RA protein AED:0.13 eAED:0.13 QI:246/1/1/1/1/1/2/2993/817
MTTISNHSNPLIDPLARTKGGCATTRTPNEQVEEANMNNPTHVKEEREEDEGYDGMMPILGISNQEVDEEIASTEADGTDDGGDQDCGAVSQHHGQSVEKKILTAALVTSIADASTSCSASGPTPAHDDGGAKEATNRQVVRTRPHADNSERDLSHTIEFPHHGQEEQSGAHALIMDHASHVTPVTSEASSFSSVETMGDHESSATADISMVCAYNQDCDSIPQLGDTKSQPQTSAVTVAARPVVSNNPSSHSSGNARTIYSRASKSAASTAVSAALAPTIKSSAANGSSAPTGLAPAKRKIDAVSSGMQAPGVGKLVYPTVPPLNQSLPSFAPPSGPYYSASSSVPNPLAVPPPPQPQDPYQYLSQYEQDPSNNETHESNSLISSNPHASLPDVNASSTSCGGNKKNSEDTTDSFTAIAESMSQQQYQTDNLMSSSTNELMSSQHQAQEGRGRIFSIDLDPAVLDFVESVVDPLVPSDEADGVTQGRARNYSVTFDDDVHSNSGRISYRRDRGFSFEFFAFGINEDELLPPIDDGASSADADAIENRLRGDSIIFDPISFHDGGIHETSALMHVKHETFEGDVQDPPGSHATVAPQGNVQFPPTIIHNTPQVAQPTTSVLPPVAAPHNIVQKEQRKVASGKPINVPIANIKATARQAKPPAQPKQRTKVKTPHNVYIPPQQPVSSSYRQTSVTTSCSTRNFPQSFNDNTIHMPHGSDAAAAAAAGMAHSSASTPSTDGFSGISHTSCPMELLNKGGRIGIYLPEERKARIAKFHHKRKQRMWRKRIKYDCRKKLADSRPRIKGRFVKRSDVDGEEE